MAIIVIFLIVDQANFSLLYCKVSVNNVMCNTICNVLWQEVQVSSKELLSFSKWQTLVSHILHSCPEQHLSVAMLAFIQL